MCVAGCCGADGGDRLRNKHRLAPSPRRAIRFVSVMSASVKPRLAGRQPSNRGGVPRVMTRLSSPNRLPASAGPL